MTKQVVVLSICVAFLILAVGALVWILVDWIAEKRRIKKVKQAHEAWDRERAERGPEPEKDLEMEDNREEHYVAHVGLHKETMGLIELIQMRTQTESPGEVMCHALQFYSEIVNLYGPGDQLILYKPSETETPTLITFKPLERIGKKIEG